jgi:nucleoside-diphosphate-sugar epimerase
MSNHDLLVVAGAGGFIGGHLVKKLREDGFEKIRAVDQKPISERYAVFDDVENLSLHLKKAVGIVEEIAGTKLKRRYDLSAPKGVNGRNSDNALIQKTFHWEPSTRLRVGMEQTYRWIYDQMSAREPALNAA